MPLLILGLLLIIGLLAYSIVRYINSGEEDTRSVRERYPHAFPMVVNPDKVRQNKESGDGDSAGPESTAGNHEEVYDADSYVESDSLRGDIDHMIRNLKYDLKDRASDMKDKAKERGIDVDRIRDQFRRNDDSTGSENNTVEFPRDNIEAEKRKRNINSD